MEEPRTRSSRCTLLPRASSIIFDGLTGDEAKTGLTGLTVLVNGRHYLRQHCQYKRRTALLVLSAELYRRANGGAVAGRALQGSVNRRQPRRSRPHLVITGPRPVVPDSIRNPGRRGGSRNPGVGEQLRKGRAKWLAVQLGSGRRYSLARVRGWPPSRTRWRAWARSYAV